MGILLFFFGAILASFAGVVSERLYTGQSWAKGRSRCDSCGRELTARDLVPIVSVLVAWGRCRVCRAKLSLRSTFGELLLGLLFAISYIKLDLSFTLAVFLTILVVLYILTLYDLRHTIVPPSFSLALLILSFFFALIQSNSREEFGSVLVVAGSIGLAFFLLHVLSRGRAMGLGDAPVALALSLLIGSRAFVGLVFSFWIGGVIGIVLLAMRYRGHRISSEVPFVPFLAAGYLLAFFTTWNPFGF